MPCEGLKCYVIDLNLKREPSEQVIKENKSTNSHHKKEIVLD